MKQRKTLAIMVSVFLFAFFSFNAAFGFSHSVLVSDDYPGYFQLRLLPSPHDTAPQTQELYVRAYNKTQNDLYAPILDYIRTKNAQIVPYDQLNRMKIASNVQIVALGDLFAGESQFVVDDGAKNVLEHYKEWEKDNLGAVFLYDVHVLDLQTEKALQPSQKQNLKREGLVLYGKNNAEAVDLQIAYKLDQKDEKTQQETLRIDLKNAPKSNNGKAIKRQYLASSGKTTLWLDYGLYGVVGLLFVLLFAILALFWPQLRKKLWPELKHYELLDEISILEARNRINKD